MPMRTRVTLGAERCRQVGRTARATATLRDMRGGPRVLGIVLAGGEGKRLAPLTQDRAKPAVPFGGDPRPIDLLPSEPGNAEIRQIAGLSWEGAVEGKRVKFGGRRINKKK